MCDTESRSQPSAEETLGLMELTETVLMVRSFEDFAERLLPGIARMTQSRSAFLYIADSRLPAPHFFQNGFQPEDAPEIEKMCDRQFDRLSTQSNLQPVSVSVSKACKLVSNLILHPMRDRRHMHRYDWAFNA